VNSQLTAVGRTGKQRRIRCSLIAADGLVPCELVIGRIGVRGNPDEADPLLIAVRAAADRPAEPQEDDADGAAEAQGEGAGGSRLSGLQAITRRLDLVTAVARLLLENEGFSESRTLQRCARLIARELNAWVIVDMERRNRVRRQFAIGPDDPGLTELTSAVAAVDPPPGSVPDAVHESGHPALIAHAEDADALGSSLDGEPLLIKLDATSVLSVPLTDGENRYGVLTLVRRTRDGHFKVADLALVTELGEQMALAIRVNRMFRRRGDTVEALHASLVPRRRPEIPGVEIAAMYLAAAEDPEVGGDFYDVYQTLDGWGLAVGDVSGMGEEAAAVMAAARHAIRVLARRCADPGEVLAGANEIVLAEELALDGGFVTANIAHLTWQDSKLRVVVGSAGHPAAAVLRSDGRVRMMGGGGLPLGLFADAEPATQELVLDTGDVLFLYTDGVAQARGPDHAYFAERLADELAGLAGLPPDQLVASMRQAMNDFSAGNLVDDVTMLVIRVGQQENGRAGQRDRRRSPSRPRS
jgi:serine phosphatase RsbU (regulator of sigma subunit)